MYVPNYIPQPVEVPGNVSQAPWQAKLGFLRSVTALHLGSVAIVVCLSFCPWPHWKPFLGFELLMGVLLVACIARILTRGTEWDQRLAVVLLPSCLALVAALAASLFRSGVPVWSPLVGVVAAGIYTACCGRDFSFIGQYLLSLIASQVVLAVLAPVLHQSPAQAAWSMALNAAYLSFFCYDLASLMSRRRASETVAAVIDLYRDVLNVFGWTLRCIKHWHRHRIWAGPWT